MSKKSGDVEMRKLFSIVPLKNFSTEKMRKKKLSNLASSAVRLTKTPFGTWQFRKIGVLVNFITQELKSL